MGEVLAGVNGCAAGPVFRVANVGGTVAPDACLISVANDCTRQEQASSHAQQYASVEGRFSEWFDHLLNDTPAGGLERFPADLH